jgi:hypothetical protein
MTLRTPRAAALALFALVALPALGAEDRVIISGSVSFSEMTDSRGEQAFHRLTGQSAYFNTRTGSLTTGNQLDGITSFDSENSVFEISYNEVFPEASLTDYLHFGYFGVVETVGYDEHGDEEILDVSFVIASPFGIFPDTDFRVENIFPGIDEASLVHALTNSFDSPLFFDVLFSAVGSDDFRGLIGLGRVDSEGAVEEIRNGDVMMLLAFNRDDDLASEIGFLETFILRVPAPGVLALGALAGITAARRRRGTS